MARVKKRVALAVLWHSLAYMCKKLAVRAEIEDGSRTKVEVKISARVGGVVLEESLDGYLLVGRPTGKASSSSAPAKDVVAYLLAQMPEARRNRELQRLPALYAKGSVIPPVDAVVQEQAEQLLAQLRTQKTDVKAGAVRFEPAAVE